MLVRADAIPVVEMVKAAEAVDVEAAALWLHMGLWDALGEMIDDNRPEIEAVWKSVVAAKSDRARGVLVRKALERRVAGGEIDDVVKAAAGLSLVRGYVAKEETTQERREHAAHETRDAQGRFARTKQERTAYDAMDGLTRSDKDLQGRAEGVAGELQGDRYRQMRVVGNALVATGHPKAMAAGGVVRVAAEVGPSAEDVLGTHLRRVAYRYRGTEKRPDRQLVRETKETTALLGELTSGNAQTVARAQSALADTAPGEWGKGSLIARLPEAGKKGWSDDTLEMRTTGDVATAHLMRQLPTQQEALLSQEAGRTPPSVGVLIDRDGDVVSEAMGYQGDHYVPFDLKNLKRLQGGSYVRTRALGGPTSEDIYTGLLTGARQMTVVSRSGVFTVEFDPDLRGGRRYSDKARQMVDRYSRLLDVVEGGQTQSGKPLYAHDISEDEKRSIRRAAFEAVGYDNPDDAETLAQRRINEARLRAEHESRFTEEDLDKETDKRLQEWIQENTRTRTGAPSTTEIGRQREQIRREALDSMRVTRERDQVRRLQLNAEGYYRAMQSLRREFPYYIRDVDYEPLPEFEERRRTRERGEPPAAESAPGARASSTHVARGALVPAKQDRAYRRKGGEEAAAEGETAGAGPSAPKGGAPAEAGATFADTLRNERFQDQVASQSHVLRIALASDPTMGPVVPDLPKPAEGGMDRDYSMQALSSDEEYVKWLVSPGNTVTHGDNTKVARFLLEEATPQEIRRAINGLDTVSRTAPMEGTFSRERVDVFRRTLEAVSRAREPYAPTGGSAVLHAPDPDDPKPYPFPEIAGNAMVSDEKFDKIRTTLEVSDGRMAVAFKWADELSNKSAASELRRDVHEFNAAVRWGQQRKSAPAGEPVEKPDDLRGSDISAADAEEMAAKPENSRLYKDLQARQKAWAWVYTKRLRDALRGVTGGGAAPKAQLAIEGGKSARLVTSSRRVVWHSPDDPLSQALAKRLSRRRPT